MKVLLQGQRYKPAEAVEVGIVDELAATPEEMLDKARAWIKANPEAVAAVGRARATGCPAARRPARSSPACCPAFPANLRKQLKGAPMPAPHHIMCAAVEGATVDFDTAFTHRGPLLRQPGHAARSRRT